MGPHSLPGTRRHRRVLRSSDAKHVGYAAVTWSQADTKDAFWMTRHGPTNDDVFPCEDHEYGI